jgi:hypothetical protein
MQMYELWRVSPKGEIAVRTEAPLLDQLALALLEFGTQADLIRLISVSHHAPACLASASRRARRSLVRLKVHECAH